MICGSCDVFTKESYVMHAKINESEFIRTLCKARLQGGRVIDCIIVMIDDIFLSSQNIF